MRAKVRSWIDLVEHGGPDHFMELVFDRDVGALVRALDTTGFIRTELGDAAMFSELRAELPCATFDLYADVAHNDALLANLRGITRTNLWSYQTMMVGAGRVWIEHGYGSSSPDVLAVEARVLELAATGAARLVSWSIEHGGQGHPHGVARAGASAVDLAAALEWNP
ncbi:Hypothetical protein A7982_07936 [Minicystis rosea]|nr:Hypothetical protein A7982_07936 [Minicystis rosea]